MINNLKNDEICKQIYATKDYKKFKFLKGNRQIDGKRVDRLVDSMKQKCTMTLIKVNEKFEILDGQHNFTARKKLNKIIYYYIANKEQLEDVWIDNSNRSNWKRWDFVLSYASTGKINYIKLVELSKRYFQFQQKELFIKIALGEYTNIRSGKALKKDTIKDGTFEFKDYYKSVEIFDKLIDFKIIQGVNYTNYMFIRAILYFFRSKKYNHERMIDQIRKYPFLVRRIDIQGNIEELLRKYNYNKVQRLNITDLR